MALWRRKWVLEGVVRQVRGTSERSGRKWVRGTSDKILEAQVSTLPCRVADEPFLGSQMTELPAMFRVTDEPFLGSQMTGEPIVNYPLIYYYHYITIWVIDSTLWYTNTAIEHGHLQVDLPLKNGDFL